MTRRGALAAAAAAAALSACGRRGPAPQSDFAGLIEDFGLELIADSPELATRIGAADPNPSTRSVDRLDDRSAGAVDLRRDAILRRRAQIKAIDRARLSTADKVSYDAISSSLRLLDAGAQFDFGRFSQLGGFAPYVLNHLDCAALTLPDFLDSQHVIARIEDADSYVARLGRMARALDDETQRARADAGAGVIPPAAVLDRTAAALAAIAGQPPETAGVVLSLRRRLEAMVGTIEPGRTAPGQAHAVELLTDASKLFAAEIAPAYRRALAAVQDMRARAPADPGVWRAPEGAAYYAAALANETTTAHTPQEVHEIGLQRVKEVQAQIDVALRALGSMQGDVGPRLAALAADPRFRYPDTDESRAQVLVDMRAARTRIEQRMSGWFSARTRAPLEFRAAPPSAPAGQPTAFYQPPRPAARQPGVVVVDTRDLSALVKFDLTTLAAHEGVPGHHLQMASTQEATGLPLVRRLMACPGFIEGWGVYAEQLVDEMGVYDGDPYGRLGYLRWRLWRAARMVVDTGIHALRWPREQAIGYLAELTGDAPGLVAAEVDRYAVWPGQAAAYELGALKLTELREKARATMGARFDIKAYHALLLTGGAVPLDALAGAVDVWIAGRA
ncbi:MAG: DUF885 family protein [Alphaproteobacteria bacterium]|nr:DUF885 family protein [Alphaproteobacteria bacterium]